MFSHNKKINICGSYLWVHTIHETFIWVWNHLHWGFKQAAVWCENTADYWFVRERRYYLAAFNLYWNKSCCIAVTKIQLLRNKNIFPLISSISPVCVGSLTPVSHGVACWHWGDGICSEKLELVPCCQKLCHMQYFLGYFSKWLNWLTYAVFLEISWDFTLMSAGKLVKSSSAIWCSLVVWECQSPHIFDPGGKWTPSPAVLVQRATHQAAHQGCAALQGKE